VAKYFCKRPRRWRGDAAAYSRCILARLMTRSPLRMASFSESCCQPVRPCLSAAFKRSRAKSVGVGLRPRAVRQVMGLSVALDPYSESQEFTEEGWIHANFAWPTTA